MKDIKFFKRQQVPLEKHKARVIQALELKDIDERKKVMEEAGFNTFLLKNKDVFLDMLTDSGVNALSDFQLAAMMFADDAYAGSRTFDRFEAKCQDIFGMPFVLPAHQGRACENIIAQTFVKPGDVTIMNYHFTTTKAHIMINGGSVIEALIPEGLEIESEHPFKGNMDLERLEEEIKNNESVAFVRMEAGTNLIGGQPFSLENIKGVSKICKENNIPLVLDASLLTDNLYFIKVREEACKDMSIREITREIANQCDIIYFSARKLGSARGGAILLRDHDVFVSMQSLVTLYEGFLTYGGMSIKDMEAVTVGLEEAMTLDMVEQGPIFIEAMVDRLKEAGVPVVTPAGGLGCHIDATKFLEHIPQEQYRSAALSAAFYMVSGIRGMERGTFSEERNEDGSEHFASMELLRLALPRRVFTLSHIEFCVDRMIWLWENRHLVGGLEFEYEPKILRFFTGRCKPIGDWVENLVKKFKEDLPDSF